MFCPYCGSFNRAGAVFCKKCGHSLKEEEVIIDPMGVLGQEESREEKASATSYDRPHIPSDVIQDKWHEEEEPIPSREEPLPEGLIPEELHPGKRHEEKIETVSREEVIEEKLEYKCESEGQQVEETPTLEPSREKEEAIPTPIPESLKEAEKTKIYKEQPPEEPEPVSESAEKVEEVKAEEMPWETAEMGEIEEKEEIAEETAAPVSVKDEEEPPIPVSVEKNEEDSAIPKSEFQQETKKTKPESCESQEVKLKTKYKDSAKLTIPDQPEIPETLKFLKNGRYELVKQLGAGGTGRIFLAVDHKMGANIVLKELCPLTVRASTLKYLEKRFKEEAKLLFRLNHTGFPRVMDYFTERGRLLIIMQYIEGKNLFSLLKEQPEGRFPIDQCMKWFGEMLDLLIILHRQEPPIIHRDIKPSNIMIDNRGRLYLVDLGFARALDPKGHMTRVGTYGYASPEHYSGNFSPTSDVFSLAATFHHLLTGESPDKRGDPFSYPPVYKYVPGFPRDFQKIFDKMLAMSKKTRYQSADEVKKDFDKFREMYNL